MDPKSIISSLSERPAEEHVTIGEHVLTVRRVSPMVAMRAAGKARDSEDKWMAELAAYSIVDGNDRPLANEDGVQAVLSLPPGDFMAIATGAMRVNGFDPGN